MHPLRDGLLLRRIPALPIGSMPERHDSRAASEHRRVFCIAFLLCILVTPSTLVAAGQCVSSTRIPLTLVLGSLAFHRQLTFAPPLQCLSIQRSSPCAGLHALGFPS